MTRTRAACAVVVAMCVSGFAAGPCVAQAGTGNASVVILPGVRVSTDAPGCTEADRSGGGATSLSFECLNRAVAPAGPPAVAGPLDGDIRRLSTNRLGLYNAAGLSHRMGPNLGTSVQPYRPHVTYPTPLIPAH